MDVSNKIVSYARQRPTAFLLIALVSTWLLMMLVLLVCQLIGAPFGLNIHATGEDRVWTDLLDKGGFTTHRSWWALASRNPLGPWWYDAITPLLSIHSSGLYLSKRFVELSIAVLSALVVFEIFDRKKLGLSYSLGALVLVWNFTGYIEQILYVMLIALSFSLLSLYAYLRYLKTQRGVVEWLLLSLTAYFVALGTYTIQCGLPLAVLVCSLAYGTAAMPAGSKTTVWYRSWYDTIYFGVVFVLFCMVWITTQGPTSSYFKVSASLITKNAWTSIKNMLWHQDTVDLTRSMFQNWSIFSIATVFTISLVTMAIVMRWLQKRERELSTPSPSMQMQWNPCAVFFAIAMSIAIPTFALEAMSSLWYPGSRSRMIQQAFQPFLFLSILLALVTYVRGLKKYPYIVEAGLLTSIAFGVVVGFEYNRKLAELSMYERNLVAGLKQIAPNIYRPTKFVVRLENDDWYGGRNTELNRILMKQSFDSDLVTLDAVYKGAADPTCCVKLASDDLGVFCPSSNKYFPFSDVVFATYDGRKVTALTELDASTFAGYQLCFERETSHKVDRLANMRPSSEKVEFQFDLSPPGTGWSFIETSPKGDSFVWMSGQSASFEFYRFANTPVQLRFKTLQPMATDIRDSLKVSVQGKAIPLRVVDDSDNEWTYEGEIPTASQDEISVLKFSVDRTMLPIGGTRELAIPFDWIEFNHESADSTRLSALPHETLNIEIK